MNTDNELIKNEKMTLQRAFDELNISLEEVELTNFNYEYIKKKYHQLALKWHPDKNADSGATVKFQKINEAYEYLLKELKEELNIINEDDNLHNNVNADVVTDFVSSKSKIYINILGTFISSLFNKNKKDLTYNDLLIQIIKSIVINCEDITASYLKKLFEDLDKHTAIEIYQIVYRYKDILYVSNDTLELVSLIIKEKIQQSQQKDRVFILRPSIKDLLDHNIYKLYVDCELYLAPLWHNELYFDTKDGSEIIVLCQPKLPSNIMIDENNNVYYEKTIHIETELPFLIKNSNFVSLEIGDKWFSIPLDRLYLKKEQLYRFKGQGVSRIMEKDMYNVSNKADIIIKITLL